MKIFLDLQRDSDNTSLPGNVEITGNTSYVTIQLKNPERTVTFPRRDLEAALEATDH